MSKTTPVRWWRDDAQRYVTRGPQIVPAAKCEAMQWALDLISQPINPGLWHTLTSDPWGAQAMLEGRSIADPIADIRHWLDEQRREVERMNRERGE